MEDHLSLIFYLTERIENIVVTKKNHTTSLRCTSFPVSPAYLAVPNKKYFYGVLLNQNQKLSSSFNGSTKSLYEDESRSLRRELNPEKITRQAVC